MTDTTQPPAETLAPCPLCGRTPKRNGRGGTGGVLCAGDNVTVGMIHRFQTYGADQAEADAAWNAAALTRRAGGDAIPAGEACTCQRFPTHQANDCPTHGLEAPFDGVPHDTPKPPAGGDAGAVERERDEARQIVRDIYWMARRYADGRQSYAVGMFNDAVRKAYDAGWLTHRMNDEPAFARDGMFSGEWKSIEQRARDAEERLAALALPAPVVEREKIARVLFDQRQTAHNFDDAADAAPESDAGTLYSIAHDDADAVIAALSEGRSQRTIP